MWGVEIAKMLGIRRLTSESRTNREKSESLLGVKN